MEWVGAGRANEGTKSSEGIGKLWGGIGDRREAHKVWKGE